MSGEPITLDLGVYLVTRRVGGLERVVAAAVAGGVGIVQLRDKDADSASLAARAARLRSITAPHGVPVVVDDDLRAAAAVDGVHVGPDDAHPVEARAALGPDAIVGWSIHDLAQLDDEAALAASTYLAVSPVWATATKPDHGAPWGIDGVRRVVDAVAGRLAVVAIGGIDATNAARVVTAGAAGVAVVSAICDAPDPRAAAEELRRAVDRAAISGRPS